jgi:hypothetical protein
MDIFSQQHSFQNVLQELSKFTYGLRLGDWIVIMAYLGHGRFWGKPDPNAYLMYTAPQDSGDFEAQATKTRNIRKCFWRRYELLLKFAWKKNTDFPIPSRTTTLSSVGPHNQTSQNASQRGCLENGNLALHSRLWSPTWTVMILSTLQAFRKRSSLCLLCLHMEGEIHRTMLPTFAVVWRK